MVDFVKQSSGLFLPEKPQLLKIGGVFRGQIIRDGCLIDDFEYPNLVVNEGLIDILNVYLANSTQSTQWYLGLVGGTGGYTPGSSDAASNISSRASESTYYAANPNRPQWIPTAATTTFGPTISNSANTATSTYTMNATTTIYGAFLINAVGINTGTKLFASSLFGAGKAVVNGDMLILTYTLSSSSV
jgi:hypothetical protein